MDIPDDTIRNLYELWRATRHDVFLDIMDALQTTRVDAPVDQEEEEAIVVFPDPVVLPAPTVGGVRRMTDLQAQTLRHMR